MLAGIHDAVCTTYDSYADIGAILYDTRTQEQEAVMSTVNESSSLTNSIGDSLIGESPYEKHSIQDDAWRVWKTVEIQASQPTDVTGPEAGLFEGKMSEIMWRLLPQKPHEYHQVIRNYLKSTGNAYCLRPRGPAGPLWWISHVWRDARAIPVVGRPDQSPAAHSNGAVTQNDATHDSETMKKDLDKAIAVEASDEPNERFTLDPQWYSEFVYILSRSGPDGVVTRIFKWISKRDNSFTTKNINDQLNVPMMTITSHLNMLYDAEIITQIRGPQQKLKGTAVSLPALWGFTIDGQREELQRALEHATEAPVTQRELIGTVADAIFNSLTTVEETPREVSRRMKLARTVVYSTLRELEISGKIKRNKKDGQNVRYSRIPTKRAESTISETPPDAPPVDAAAVSGVALESQEIGQTPPPPAVHSEPSSTRIAEVSELGEIGVVAHLLDDLISQRVAERVEQELGVRQAALVTENRALKAENLELKAWRTRMEEAFKR